MDATSLCIDSTLKITKRQDIPTLNVYLRLRPFIADEIERGENQKLIDILDDKHIAIRLYPTIHNTIRTLHTSYNEYEVTQIFDHHCDQQELFEQILLQQTNEFFTGSNLLFCTLGLTNSGKTHTMFGTVSEPGLIPQCLHRIFLNIGSNIDEKMLFKPLGLENLMPTIDSDLNTEVVVRNYIFKDEKRMRLPRIIQHQNDLQDLSVEDEHYSLWISFFELYNENIYDLLVHPKDMKARKNLRLMQTETSTMIKNLIQIPVFDINEAEDIIKFGLTNRSTSKTNLNEASSRSHAVLCITLITVNEFSEEPTMSHMYICDLAGNEPVNGTGKQLTETCNINTSLMTFKDCIRVLNENQSSKKQMLIPYRNSALTTIFRPFFIGRGRTLICCNISPCATFITQTNDLLKFCALAQKTVIVPCERKIGSGLIRPQRKSKNKGPKRLGKRSLLREKNEKNLTHNDATECIVEPDIQTVDGLSATIPTNPTKINYWKYCTKKALDLLQKHAFNRRLFMIERHQERIQIIKYLLQQRQHIEALINDKQSISIQNELLLKDLHTEQDNHHHTQQLYSNIIVNEKQYYQKLLKLEKQYHEQNLHSHEEVDSLKKQLKTLQQQFEHLTTEHLKTVEQTDLEKFKYREQEMEFQSEIQRLKRDLGLELFRKQDAEKKARSFEDKLHHEQTQYQKLQYDFMKNQHELKTLQVKYDALQMELDEIRQNKTAKSIRMNHVIDAKTSTTTINEEQSMTKPQRRSTRTKRRTNEEAHREPEIQQPKRTTRNRSAATIQSDELNSGRKAKTNAKKTVVMSVKQTRTKIEEDKPDSKPKTTGVRGRPRKQVVEAPPVPVLQESNSPLYATIQRDPSLDRASFTTVTVNASVIHATPSNDKTNTVPKPSTFKRIQSFFRATPTSTNSTKVNRVVQVKSTVVAFGSSTPTNRMPPSVVKTPVPSVVPTPKSKYNLRTRLFHNPISKHEEEQEEKKPEPKKKLRSRK